MCRASLARRTLHFMGRSDLALVEEVLRDTDDPQVMDTTGLLGVLHINGCYVERSSGSPKSWSSLFSMPAVDTTSSLKFEKPNMLDGKFVVEVSNEELDDGAEHWKFAMVGHFIGAKPYFLTVKAKVFSMWQPKGEFEAFSLSSGFLIFKLTKEEDMLVALEGG
ncbi:hypothetical protein Cni_G29300 [Canna indica]|uniref:DUF4283 domain-containing protein n=1 Tax=Canna indica TaxID=4628 RepID=A0AAQ3L5R2_9LILI|nr:hypothetical protein Cni_G29300 [Canna indica]